MISAIPPLCWTIKYNFRQQLFNGDSREWVCSSKSVFEISGKSKSFQISEQCDLTQENTGTGGIILLKLWNPGYLLHGLKEKCFHM